VEERPPTARELTDELLAFARERGKPVMIAEASPQEARNKDSHVFSAKGKTKGTSKRNKDSHVFSAVEPANKKGTKTVMSFPPCLLPMNLEKIGPDFYSVAEIT
jgi:hypothetical protein